jgi:5-methylcytosine-specific restriction endonuclease McrA
MGSMYKRGDVYWFKCYRNGVEIRKSLKTKDFSTAKIAKANIEQTIFIGGYYVPSIEIIRRRVSKEGWIANRWDRMSPRERQSIVFFISEGKCFHCGKEVFLPQNIDRHSARKTRMVMDHVIPFCNGGSDNLENFISSCGECNSKRMDGRMIIKCSR